MKVKITITQEDGDSAERTAKLACWLQNNVTDGCEVNSLVRTTKEGVTTINAQGAAPDYGMAGPL